MIFVSFNSWHVTLSPQIGNRIWVERFKNDVKRSSVMSFHLVRSRHHTQYDTFIYCGVLVCTVHNNVRVNRRNRNQYDSGWAGRIKICVLLTKILLLQGIVFKCYYFLAGNSVWKLNKPPLSVRTLNNANLTLPYTSFSSFLSIALILRLLIVNFICTIIFPNFCRPLDTLVCNVSPHGRIGCLKLYQV